MTDKNDSESSYYYSASANAFYPVSMKQNYLDAGSFPDDAKEVDDDIYQQFSADFPPDGKMRIAGEDGLPAWEDIPPPTPEERIRQAEYEKQKRLQEAAKAIAPLQDAADLDIATAEETAALKEWKRYRVMLSRVDTSAGADVVWPASPAG